MGKRRIVLFSRIILLVIICLGLYCYQGEKHIKAYNLQGYSLPSKIAAVRWNTSSEWIKQAFNSARVDWTNSVSSNLYMASTSVNTFSTYFLLSSSEYGKMVPTLSGQYIASFDAKINTGNTANLMYANVVRSTACHEIGHVLGLGDRDSGTAIMNRQRDRNTIYTPKQDDKNGVNAVYG